MADQQDQLSSGGSVEKASASADTSKLRGKGSSSGSSGYRKRQNTGTISDTVEEKRRRQTTGDPQASQVDSNTAHTHLIDSSKGEGRIRGERRNHGSSLESYPGNCIYNLQSEYPYIIYIINSTLFLFFFFIYHQFMYHNTIVKF